MLKLSAVIITYNEERYIDKCLKSLTNVADEIIVVDSYSTDDTKIICEKYNVSFIEQKFLGYVEQKNFALKQASYNHIVSLDGDESLSHELQQSILKVKSNWTNDGYYCNRYNNFCGQWIKYSDWYPNKKIRVFDKRKSCWKGINPHDQVFVNSSKKIGKLKGDILHLTYQSYSEFNQKVESFSSISAESYYKLGKRSNLFKIIWNPSWAFFKSYILRLGFLDGKNGLFICYQTGKRTFLKYAKLWKIQKTNSL